MTAPITPANTPKTIPMRVSPIPTARRRRILYLFFGHLWSTVRGQAHTAMDGHGVTPTFSPLS